MRGLHGQAGVVLIQKPQRLNEKRKYSYIYLKLCGEFVTDPTNGINGIMDLKTLQWDDKLADAYELPKDLWPEIHTPGEIVGELSTESASVLGLKQNTPILLGGGDQQCAALGQGVIEKVKQNLPKEQGLL